MRFLKTLERNRTYRAQMLVRVQNAIDHASEFKHACVLLRASDFMALGSLKMHEELRDRGLLHYHDRLAELQRSPGHMIFFSHQWTAHGVPDHTGEQYKCMVSSMLHIIAAEGWRLRHTWVWVDYISIPQRCRGMQHLAINSLATYAACADAFAIVAPPVAHQNTGQMLTMASYNQRMWCRTENLCFSLCQGSGSMWMSAAHNDCHRLSEDRDFLRSNLYVFEGEATVEDDKLTLVEPLLGLYAELYVKMRYSSSGESASVNDNSQTSTSSPQHSASRDSASRDSANRNNADREANARRRTSIAAVVNETLFRAYRVTVHGEALTPRRRQAMRNPITPHRPSRRDSTPLELTADVLIEELLVHKARIFPRSLKLRRKNSYGREHTVAVSLFGDLVSAMELRIDRDESTRRLLQGRTEHRLARAGATLMENAARKLQAAVRKKLRGAVHTSIVGAHMLRVASGGPLSGHQSDESPSAAPSLVAVSMPPPMPPPPPTGCLAGMGGMAEQELTENLSGGDYEQSRPMAATSSAGSFTTVAEAL